MNLPVAPYELFLHCQVQERCMHAILNSVEKAPKLYHCFHSYWYGWNTATRILGTMLEGQSPEQIKATFCEAIEHPETEDAEIDRTYSVIALQYCEERL